MTDEEGDVFYDPVPYLLYSQLDGALVGGNNSISAKVERVIMMLQGRFQYLNTQNIAALNEVSGLLVRNYLKLSGGARLKNRFRFIEIYGLCRKIRRGIHSLFLAALLKKI